MSASPAESVTPTSAVLTSAAKHIAVVCAQENLDFLTCKDNDPNPAACLEQGKKVTNCVANLYVWLFWVWVQLGVAALHVWFHNMLHPRNRLADINSRCKAEFKDYYECMDYYRYAHH